MVMKMKRVGLFLLLLSGAVICHTQVQTAVLAAGERCVKVLIPSLYFFSILASWCIRSGLLRQMTSLWHSRHLNGYLLGVLLFSQIGGYPVGAQLLHGMRQAGIMTAEQESRMICVCMGCGPGFLLGTVCGRLSPGIGAWMMLSVMLPNLLIGIFLAWHVTLSDGEQQTSHGASALTEAVESAASAMLKICGMVLGMAALLGIAEEAGVFHIAGLLTPLSPERTAAALRTVAEVSCITEFMQQGGSLPMAAALLSFGGLCVHLQAAAITEGTLSWIPFWCIRGLCAVLSYGICRAGLMLLFPEVLPASIAYQDNVQAACEESVVPGMMLMMMSFLLLRRTAEKN